MPIHKSGSGWQWGNHGKVYPTRAGAEKQAEAAHANGFTGDAAVMAAGIAYIDPDGNVLLLKRSPDSDHPGEWCLPGGHIDDGETAEQAARRESSEEIGHFPYGDLEQIARLVSDEGVDFTTFGYAVDEQFEPTLNDEHTEHIWAPVKKLPKSTHPGVKAALTQDACQCDSCKTKRTNDAVTASGFFFEEELGPNQYFTPEGYLICEAVPIARTGVQEYADIELPDLEAGPDGLILVERDPDVVFAPETLASTLGKPPTINHPKEQVGPRNWSILSKGSTFNPRRGEDDQSDLLIADLMITDEFAINEIRNNGLKGISVGYDADYEQIAPGRARQTSIMVNHIALVRNPRCGPVCSVQDSKPSLGDPPMAVKKGAESLKDKLRKLFMTRDSEAFEKALSEEVKDDAEGMEKNVPDIHIHMPGAEKVGAGDTMDADDPAAAGEGGNPAEQKIMAAIQALTETVTAIGERVAKLESGNTADADPAADPENDPDAEPPTNDADPDDKDGKTYDSASLRDEFQDAKARAEILAPGVKLPTFDAKSDKKKTTDSICVLRRRALKAALENDNAAIVKSVVGNADVSKMTCDAAAMAFNAASEMVKAKNKAASSAQIHDASKKSINQIHADFWASRKA